MDNDYVIEAKNLTASYGDQIIWNNANFKIKKGEFIGLLGPNGAGKSTLLNLILGLKAAKSGELRVLGNNPSKGNPRLGYFPQRHSVDADAKLMALEYIRVSIRGNQWGFNWPTQAHFDRNKALKILKQLDATHLAHKNLSQLSGGELQKIFLAASLINQPDILLLDEPLANLDIKRASQLISMVKKISKNNDMTIILIAHDINNLIPVLDRIIYIANKKVATGTIAEVITSKRLSELYEAPVEVLQDSRGRLAVLGIEEALHHDN